MVKKENMQNQSNSLLQTASSKHLGAGKFALLAFRSNVRPPVKRVKVVRSSDSRLSDLTGSIDATGKPAVVKEIQNVDLDVESSVLAMSMNSSNFSTPSIKQSYGGQGAKAHVPLLPSVGKAVKTQPQPGASNHKFFSRDTRPLQKKSMELQKGITISAPSPMTLDRVQVQMGQERSAPESKEYRQQQSEIKLKQEEESKRALQKQAKEEAKQRIIEEAQREQGEGFEAELPDFHQDDEAGKKKSLVKKILGKIKPKSPRKKGQDTGNDNPAPRIGPLNVNEARLLARRALKATRQKMPSPPQNSLRGTQIMNNPVPMTEVVMTKKEDSVSDLDASTRKFPVNEILMNGRDQVRDDESVSTLGTPHVFERHLHTSLCRSRKSDIRDPTPTNEIDGVNQPPIQNREPDGALYRRVEPTESEREQKCDSRLLHRNGQALIDQVDSISAWSANAENSAVTDGTEAIEMRLGGCDPNRIAPTQNNLPMGRLSKPKSSELNYAFSAFCVGGQNNARTQVQPTTRSIDADDWAGTGALNGYDQSRTEDAESEHESKNESMPTPGQSTSSNDEPERKANETARKLAPLSPTAAFSSAIDAAIRQVETEMRGREDGLQGPETDVENEFNPRRESVSTTEPLPGLNSDKAPQVGDAGQDVGDAGQEGIQQMLSPIEEDGEESKKSLQSPRTATSKSSKSRDLSEIAWSSDCSEFREDRAPHATMEKAPVGDSGREGKTPSPADEGGKESKRSLSLLHSTTSKSSKSRDLTETGWSSDRSDQYKNRTRHKNTNTEEEHEKHSLPDLEKAGENPLRTNQKSVDEVEFPARSETEPNLNVAFSCENLESVETQAFDVECAENFELEANRVVDVIDLTDIPSRSLEEPDSDDIVEDAISYKKSGIVGPKHTPVTFDDFMEIAASRLTMGSEPSKPWDREDRYAIERDDDSPKEVIIGELVEMKSSNSSLPVVQGVEISVEEPRRQRKVLAEVTPKASGGNKSSIFGSCEQRRTDGALSPLNSHRESIKHADPSASMSASLASMPRSRGDPKDTIAVQNKSFEVYDDPNGDVVVCYDENGQTTGRSLGRKSGAEPSASMSASMGSVSPSSGDPKAATAVHNQSFDIHNGSNGVCDVVCNNENGQSLTGSQGKKRLASSKKRNTVGVSGLAGYFPDGLFDLLSSEGSIHHDPKNQHESNISIDHFGPMPGEANYRTRTESTNKNGKGEQDLPSLASSGHAKPVALDLAESQQKNERIEQDSTTDADVLDSVFEYSETVLCGDGKGNRKGKHKPLGKNQKQADETLFDGERDNKAVKIERDREGITQPGEKVHKQAGGDKKALDDKGGCNKGVQVESFGMHEALGEEDELHDTDFENRENQDPTLQPPKRMSPSLGMMCGAVPLYLMYSMAKPKDSEEQEFGTTLDQDLSQARSEHFLKKRVVSSKLDSPSSSNSEAQTSNELQQDRRRNTMAKDSQDMDFATKQQGGDDILAQGECFLQEPRMAPSKFDSHSSSNSETQTSSGLRRYRSNNTVSLSIHGESSDPGSWNLGNREITSSGGEGGIQSSEHASPPLGKMLRSEDSATCSGHEILTLPSGRSSKSSRHHRSFPPTPERIETRNKVLLEKDDVYWDTLSTIASTRDRSSDRGKVEVVAAPKPGPIPIEITMTNSPREDNDARRVHVHELIRPSEEGIIKSFDETKQVKQTVKALASLIGEEKSESSLSYSLETFGLNHNHRPGRSTQQKTESSRLKGNTEFSISKVGSMSGDEPIDHPPSHTSSSDFNLDEGKCHDSLSRTSRVTSLIARFEARLANSGDNLGLHHTKTNPQEDVETDDSNGSNLAYDDNSELLLAVTRSGTDENQRSEDGPFERQLKALSSENEELINNSSDSNRGDDSIRSGIRVARDGPGVVGKREVNDKSSPSPISKIGVTAHLSETMKLGTPLGHVGEQIVEDDFEHVHLYDLHANPREVSLNLFDQGNNAKSQHSHIKTSDDSLVSIPPTVRISSQSNRSVSWGFEEIYEPPAIADDVSLVSQHGQEYRNAPSNGNITANFVATNLSNVPTRDQISALASVAAKTAASKATSPEEEVTTSSLSSQVNRSPGRQDNIGPPSGTQVVLSTDDVSKEDQYDTQTASQLRNSEEERMNEHFQFSAEEQNHGDFQEKADAANEDLHIDERVLISRTIQLSKELLSSMNVQDIEEADDEVVRSLMSFGTEDSQRFSLSLGQEQSAQSTSRADVGNGTSESVSVVLTNESGGESKSLVGNGMEWTKRYPRSLGVSNDVVPSSVVLKPSAQTDPLEIGASQKHDHSPSSQRNFASGKDETSCLARSETSANSPINVEKLFSRYDCFANHLIAQNDQLKSSSGGTVPDVESGSNLTPQILSRLDELRSQRAEALARFQFSRFSTNDMVLPKRKDHLKYYGSTKTNRSRGPEMVQNANFAPQNPEAIIVDPMEAIPRNAISTSRDAESVSTSASSRTTPSKKARDLRRQLDEALQASKEIRLTQEKLGTELRSFKSKFYQKNGELEGQAIRAMADHSGSPL